MAKTYDVVSAASLGGLVEEVNKRLAEGWELYEGHKLTAAGWSQAMVTSKEIKPPKPGEPPAELTYEESKAEFLEQANSAANLEAMTKITGPVPVVPGINEPMQVTVVATPVAEVKAKEAKATETETGTSGKWASSKAGNK